MYKIFFRNNSGFQINEKNYIVVVPNTSKTGFECNFLIYRNRGELFSFKGCISFFYNDNFYNLDEYLREKSNTFEFNKIKFFSIFDDMDVYNKLRVFSDFNEILKTINDISYFNYHHKKDSNFTLLKKHKIFYEVFLSNSKLLKVYGNGFHGSDKYYNEKNIVGYVCGDNKVEFELNGDDSDYFPNRIFAIVGRNGCGKSQFLKYTYCNYKEFFNRVQIYSSLSVGKTYFNKIAKNGEDYIDCSSKYNFSDIVNDILRFRDSHFFGMFGKYFYDFFRQERFSDVYLIESYGNEKILISSFFEKIYEEKVDFNYKIFRLIDDKQFKLSSGEYAVVNIMFNMVLTILKTDGGNLFLFDELENHLHPNFISQIMNIINKISYYSNSYVLIATHSPFVIKNLLKENIVVLKKKEEKVVSEKITFNTLGANVETISQFVFGNEEFFDLERECVSSLVDEIRHREIIDKNEVVKFLKSTCSSELISEIIFNLEN